MVTLTVVLHGLAVRRGVAVASPWRIVSCAVASDADSIACRRPGRQPGTIRRATARWTTGPAEAPGESSFNRAESTSGRPPAMTCTVIADISSTLPTGSATAGT